MKKKKLIIILGVIMIIFTAIGISYAYYIKSYSQENSNIAKTKCLNLSITNEKNDIKLEEQYPIPDSEGKKLTPYQFTITNTCEQFISYNVNLETLEGTTMDSNAIKVMVNNEAPANLATLGTTQTSINNSVESRTLVTGSLGSGDSVDYALRLWMDYGDSADLSSMNKVFNSKVVVTATIGTYKPSSYVTTLHDAILVNEYGVTDVDNAISKIEAKGTPDLSQTAPIITWQEQTGDNTRLEIVKLASNEIKSDDYTSNLTEEDSLLNISKSIAFNKSSGKYTISDIIRADPTTLDYKNNNYYIYYEVVAMNNSTNKLYTYSLYSNITVYKIIGVTKANIRSKIQNLKEYDCIKYVLEVVKLTESEVENDKSDKGLYSSLDDYGTSYYYRGNVVNNNVLFAGYKWKVVRINGDGSIRMIYNGDINSSNDYISKAEYTTFSDKAKYSGYMYGIASDTYENIRKNEIDSNVKSILDDWYKTNISAKKLDKYISDNGFCNDRSTSYFSNINSFQWQSMYRTVYSKPTLKCPNVEKDLFTLKDSSVGNKSLIYPVGLITTDELMFSGLNMNKMNRLAHLYSTDSFWTMSPYVFNSTVPATYNIVSTNSGFISNAYIKDITRSIRPVINLKADVEISGGIGTINDPYTIKEKS